MPDTPTAPFVSTAGPEGAPVEDSGPVHRASGRGHVLVTALAALAAGVWTYLVIHPAGLFADDVVNLRLIDGAERLSDTFLIPVFFTQIAPGHRVLTALQLQVGPLDRVVMHALVAGMIALSVVLGSLVMRRLHGRTAWGPVVLALALVSPAAIRTNLWYASAYHQAPSVLFGLAAVVAYLRFRDDPGRRRWLALSVLFVGVGLLFSIRVMLAVAFMGLVEHVVLRQDGLEDTLRGMWGRKRVWGWYLVPLAVYWYLAWTSGGLPSAGETGVAVESTIRGVIEVFVPLLFGFASFFSQLTSGRVPGLVLALSHAALVALAVLSVARRRDAWRGFLAAGILVFVGIYVSAAARVPFFGVNASLALRYYMEPLVYAVPLLALGFRGRPDLPHARSVEFLRGWRGPTLAVVVLVAVTASTVVGGLEQRESFSGPESAQWLEALQSSMQDRGRPVASLDVPLDPAVPAGFTRWRLSEVVFLFPGLSLARGLPAEVVTADGSIEPLRAEEVFRQPGADYADNGLVVATGGEPEGDRYCTTDRIDFTQVLAPHERPRVLLIGLTGPSEVSVELVPQPGQVGEPTARMDTSGAGETVLLPLDYFGVYAQADIVVRAVDRQQVCVEFVAILAIDNVLPATPLGRPAG